MTLRLLYAPGTCALASHIALREAGADFELELVNFAEEQQRTPAHLALNPLGRVPVLVREDGAALAENPAILAYVVKAFPDGAFGRPEAWAAAQVDSFNSFIASSVHVAFAHLFRPYRYADSEAGRQAVAVRAPDLIRSMFDIVEARLEARSGDGPWVHGAAYATCDPYLLVMSRWLWRTGVGDAARYPRTRAHADRVQARPAVLEALAAEALTPI
jgi:glutathione S-transferase